MIRLTVVRHGETYQNFSRTVQGQDPTWGRLTERGVRQAELLGRALAEHPFDIAYCSSLERAVLTLSMVLLARPGERTLPLVFADELREINLGVLHGRSHEDWRASVTGEPMAFRVEGGESWLDVQARVTQYLNENILAAHHKEILIVAHGGVNRGIIGSLLGLSMEATWDGPGVGTPQDNTCVNVLELNGGGELVSAVINDTRHLAEEFPGAGGGQRWLIDERKWELLPGGGGISTFYNPIG